MTTYPTHRFAGSDSERQSVGLPGHCERCAEVGHIKAHPNLGCGDVGCSVTHDTCRHCHQDIVRRAVGWIVPGGSFHCLTNPAPVAFAPHEPKN